MSLVRREGTFLKPDTADRAEHADRFLRAGQVLAEREDGLLEVCQLIPKREESATVVEKAEAERALETGEEISEPEE